VTGTLVSPSYDGTVVGRAPALLRLAHQMLGDPAAAGEVVSSVLSRRRVRRAVAGSDDQVVVAALVRAVLRNGGGVVTTPSELDRLPLRSRIAVVLAFAAEWDADGIAEALRRSSRRVQGDVARALGDSGEAEWRRVLNGPQWEVAPTTDVTGRAVRMAGVRRSRLRHRALGAAAAATIVAGAVVAVVRVATTPSPPPPTARVQGLLAWPARGALIRDAALLDAATSLWRTSAQPPAGRVFVLYAGRVGIGRLAVLQALGADGRALLAVAADHDVTFGHPRLRLDAVAPLPRTDVPLLTVPYDGNLEIPGLTSGPGSRVLQLLVGPGIDHVDERDSRASPGQQPRPDFTDRTLSDGLSDAWLDLSGPLPDTAVRAYRHGHLVFTGLVQQHALQPVPLAARPVPPPARWSGLPRDLQVPAWTDDVLWWAEICRAPDVEVSLVWTGDVPDITGPVRLELVTCPGRPREARWVSGIGAGALSFFDRGTGGVDAYVMLLPTASAAGPAVVVIGSTEVAAIEVEGRNVAGRVAVGRLGRTGEVLAFDARGRRLRVG
jgi:hypothetical protein